MDGMKVDLVWRTSKHVQTSPNPSVNNHFDKSDNDHSENEHTDQKINKLNVPKRDSKPESAAIDLIGVMTKTTFLVTLAVIGMFVLHRNYVLLFVKYITVIGNIFYDFFVQFLN